jgi:RNA polymerase sigma factor (sigma-70 family)
MKTKRISMRPTDRPFDALDAIERQCPSDPREQYRYGDLYSLKDHSIVKRAVQTALSDDEQGIIIYSFWNGYSLQKIARLMTLSEMTVRRLYTSALRKIRDYCLGSQGFSLSTKISTAIAA